MLRRSASTAVGVLLVAAIGAVSAPARAAAPDTVRATPAAQPAPASSNRGFIPIAPVRVLETRPAAGGSGALAPFETRRVPITTALGDVLQPVGAVALNVTVTEPEAAGFLTVWPGGDRPVASTLDFDAGETVPNGTIVGVDPGGGISIYAGTPGTVHVLVDVTGWLPVGAGFTPVRPVRVLETRAGSPGYESGGAVTAGEDRLLDVVGRAGLPAGQVGAVALNLTASAPTGSGYLTVSPAGEARPPTSSLNFVAGDVTANSQVLGVGPDGRVDLYAFLAGPSDHVDVVVDVTGWFGVDRAFHPMAPARLVDTRSGGATPAEPVRADRTYLTKIDDLAALPRGVAGAVALNVTVTAPTSDGFLTMWPAADATIGEPDHGRPATSFVNFRRGETVANTIVVGLGAGSLDVTGDGSTDVSGAVGLFINLGAADVVIDVTGWFPQDTIGLVADAVEAERYSLGVDRVAVIGCTAPSTAYSAAEIDAVMARLGAISAYYQLESAGRYVPQYSWVGTVAPSAAAGESDCLEPADVGAAASGYDGQLVVRREPSAANSTAIAYGLAGPGYPCADPACRPDVYPANGRNAIVTVNTLVATGTVANGVPAPYWMLATHELGHSLDWPHSYTGTGAGCWGGQYDNPIDVMSRPASGSPPACAVSQGPFPTAPQRTIALNRYSAGWLDPDLVRIHRGSGTTYAVGAPGSGAPELVVVPSGDGAAFTTIEARQATAGDPDATLLASGVVVHRVDQRADPWCLGVRQLGLDRCSGLDRRVQPFGAQADSYAHVFGAGAVVDLGGVVMRVEASAGGVYTIRLDGTAASFDRIPPCGLYYACAGSSVRAQTAPIVCLLGSGTDLRLAARPVSRPVDSVIRLG